MTGLEKILEDIRSEAQAQAAAALAEAQKKADEIRSAIEKEAQEECGKVAEKSAKKTADLKARAESAARLRCRQALLSRKQELISETLETAQKEIGNLESEAYFELLLRMVKKSAHAGEGEIAFGKRDLGRLPGDFEQKLQAALPKGAVLKLAEEAADIENGFILRYGGIEENCTFEAVLLANKEVLQDRIRELLFS